MDCVKLTLLVSSGSQSAKRWYSTHSTPWALFFCPSAAVPLLRGPAPVAVGATNVSVVSFGQSGRWSRSRSLRLVKKTPRCDVPPAPAPVVFGADDDTAPAAGGGEGPAAGLSRVGGLPIALLEAIGMPAERVRVWRMVAMVAFCCRYHTAVPRSDICLREEDGEECRDSHAPRAKLGFLVVDWGREASNNNTVKAICQPQTRCCDQREVMLS